MNIDIGSWFETLINWLRSDVQWLFSGISAVLRMLVDTAEYVLIAVHPAVVIAVLVVLAFVVTRRPGLPLFTLAAFLLILQMDLWLATMSTFALMFVAVTIALAIGIPLGILAALSNPVSVVVRPTLDLMQSMPVFVYLIPSVFFFGVGTIAGVAATIVFALAPAVRMTELGIRQLDLELLEAARAFGATPRLILSDVQLPLAMKSVLAGVNQVIMLALSMVVVAGMVGAGGLGSIVVQGVTRLDVAQGFEGGLAVVILAVYLDRVTGSAHSLSGFVRNLRSRRSAKPQSNPVPVNSI